MNRHICIHGHFYQPPRENPWLEAVEIQDSAYPYHDWNARVTAECYAPNTASRILNPDRKIIDIVNNYERISFNFGPSLLSWMEKHEPEIYSAVLEADKKSQERFSGHGSSIAQVYNHMIMPLANPRDKRTQIIWGIKDFEHRFQRRPEGMWLAETAVDLETLDILAEQNIAFTILAPNQARRVRKAGDRNWQDVSGSRIDPTMPYRCQLPSGKSIAVFFYDGPISRDIAFNHLLDNGEQFAQRLVSAFTNEATGPQLVHIATDGETYGHHHRNGDMALAYALYYLEAQNLARITIYGEYLEKFPPTHEVEIFEHSSWSCVHGVERWKNNCGCNSGMHAGWTQEWRASLRGALDWLRDNLTSLYEDRMSAYVEEPWSTRDSYIEVILDRSPENLERFFHQQAKRTITGDEKTAMLRLLEMQRHAMLMYTSCGWFFDEISGIETVQILQYAARSLQLAEEVARISLEAVFMNLLEKAPSNIPDFVHGGNIYRMFVQPSALDLLRVAVHYAVSSLFKDYGETEHIYTFTAHRLSLDRVEMGKLKAAIGRARIQSSLMLEEKTISFAVLHLGDQNIIGGAREFLGEEAFSEMHTQIKEHVMKGDFAEVILLLDKHFKNHSFSVWHLFKNEQRDILSRIFSQARRETENAFRQLYEHHYPIMSTVAGLNMPLPEYFRVILEFIINRDLQNLFDDGDINYDRLQWLVDETKRWSLEIDRPRLSLIVSKKIDDCMEQILIHPEDASLINQVISILKPTMALALQLDLWRSQNRYFSLGKHLAAEKQEQAKAGHAEAQAWLQAFTALGNQLKVRIM